MIWGHEHECLADPQEIRAVATHDNLEARQQQRFIIQPGSSVATALSEGESKKKHAVLLEVGARV